MGSQVQVLEPRRLFAGLPSTVFAQPSDTYTLTIGTTVPTTPLTSVHWSVTGSGRQTFEVVLPSGPSSAVLAQMMFQQTRSTLIRVEELTSDATVRQRWDMSTNPVVNSYTQFLDNGVLYDRV